MSNKTSLLGNRGFKGPQGPTGPQGDTGDKGDKGSGSISYWQLNSSSNTLSPINNYSINKSTIVGIENVDNTSDLNKQISTSCQDALNSKANKTYVHEKIQELIVDGATSDLDTLNEIAIALNNDSDLAKTLTDSIELKVPINNPTFTGTVSNITSEMIKPNNIIINSSDLDSSGNYIINANNLKDGCSIISTSITSAISSPLVGNGLNGVCYTICEVSNSNDIYIGGFFTTATNSDGTIVTVNRICKYNTVTNSYSKVGNGLNGEVRTIRAVPNSSDIYIGGVFTTATNSDGTIVTVNRICKYNTVTGYTALKSGLQSSCFAIYPVPNSNDVYIGGTFTSAYNFGTIPEAGTSRICKYNTGTGFYSSVKNGLNNACYAICPIPNSNDIYIGGAFTTAYNTGTTTIPGTSKICKYNTGTGLYSAVGNGLDNIVTSNYCFVISTVSNSNGSTDVYIGGQFTTAYNTGNTTIPGTTFICKYNTVTNSYSSLGGASVNNFCVVIYSIPNSNDIYVGGLFTSIVYLNNSSLTVNRICKLNTNINIIQTYYKNTLISSINYPNPFEVIQKNTISSKECITLVGNNKKFII